MNKTDLAATWAHFTATRDETARADLIEHYAYLTEITVKRQLSSRNVPQSVDAHDLNLAGMVGLIRAVDRYDPARGVKFQTYAIALVRGAVLEELRDQDWVPRSVRDKRKRLERARDALTDATGRDPSPGELAEAMGWDGDRLAREESETTYRRLVSLDGPACADGSLSESAMGSGLDCALQLTNMVADPGPSLETGYLDREDEWMLRVAVSRLPDRERFVVGRYYWDGRTFRAIGREMGISESRAYQLWGQAIGRLREALSGEELAGVAA